MQNVITHSQKKS
jgi:hypothetical protein